MPSTTVESATGQQASHDPQELTLRLEAVGARLVELSRKGPGKKIAAELQQCVQELRGVWAALRGLALAYDPNRLETMLQRERELRQAMEILNGTVDTLARSNERTVADMDKQLEELDGLDALGDTDLIASRLKSVTGNVREAATEMRADADRASADLDSSEQIIQAVDRKLTEAQRQVLHDSLTRVLSRVAFEQRVGELADQSAAVSGSWCLALADIDHFAAINKQHGRRVGDALLFRVAGVIQRTCETYPGAIVGRYGGEEFGVILPGCSLRQGRQVAEEIRSSVGLAKWECKTSQSANVLSATVSLGVVQHRSSEAAGPLLRRLEACLEQAKRGGRNRVVAEG
ncbi:MAG: diguanylate cyclase domain-containing protein [Candidatus Brocadiia bacterium]